MYQPVWCNLRLGKPLPGADIDKWLIPHRIEGDLMNRYHHIGRLVRILAGLAGAFVAFGVAAPAAFARVVPVPGPASGSEPATVPPAPYHTPAPAQHATITIGMPGWQIALIAIGAAILAATLAVLLDRARSARRLTSTTAA
jgi:hypothetical protein